jgi:N-acetylmuramoyl-L-alanine amidase
MNSSLKLAGIVLGEISKINRVHTNKPQQANFAVLRAPDIPAILVETDFLSNSRAEKKLRGQSFQNTFAKSITRATVKFLSASNGSLSAKKQSKSVSKYHVVKKGETLSSIAQKYNTTVSRLRKLNRMSRKSVLMAGKKLRVDSSKPAAKKRSKPAPEYHVVKRGETLGSIALKYNTTVSRLRKLNRMSRKSVLMAGKKLRIL